MRANTAHGTLGTRYTTPRRPPTQCMHEGARRAHFTLRAPKRTLAMIQGTSMHTQSLCRWLGHDERRPQPRMHAFRHTRHALGVLLICLRDLCFCLCTCCMCCRCFFLCVFNVFGVCFTKFVECDIYHVFFSLCFFLYHAFALSRCFFVYHALGVVVAVRVLCC